MKIKSGIEADIGLAKGLDDWKKVAFLLTNVPYWMVFLNLFYEFTRLIAIYAYFCIATGYYSAAASFSSSSSDSTLTQLENFYLNHIHTNSQHHQSSSDNGYDTSIKSDSMDRNTKPAIIKLGAFHSDDFGMERIIIIFLYSLLSFGVALSSTLMHLAQVRAGNWCSCCCCCCSYTPTGCSSYDVLDHLHSESSNGSDSSNVALACASGLSTSKLMNVDKKELDKLLVDAFHHNKMQKRLKLLDISCALLASFVFVTNHIDIWIDHIWIDIALSGMAFFLGIVLKRMSWYNLYAVTHGLWHIFTGNIMYRVLIAHDHPHASI